MQPSRNKSSFRTVFFWALFVFMGCFLILGGCGGGGGDDDGSDTSGDDTGNGDTVTGAALQDRKVYINQDDTILYSYDSATGEIFTYYGRRDENGIPTLITMLEYIDTEGQTFMIFYDDTGLPAKVIDETGMTLEFNYNIEDPPLALTAAGGDISLNPTQLITSVGVTATSRETEGPSTVSAIIPLDDNVLVAPDPAISSRFGEEPVGNIDIKVEKCGEPVFPSGEVWVNFRWNTTSQNTWRYPAFPSSYPGHYLCRIPQRTKDPVPEMAEAVCTAMADKFTEACKVFNPVLGGTNAVLLSDPGFQAQLCTGVAAAVTAGATPAGGALAGGACYALLRGGTITCATLGYSEYYNPEEKNVAQKLCAQVDDALESVNSAIGIDTFVVQAVADFSNSHAPSLSLPGGDSWVYSSPEQEVSAYGDYPLLEISATDPNIGEITTSPGEPKNGEGYQVTANFECAFGMDLMISVTRDGLPQAYVKRYGDTDNKSVSLDVSGNPPGKTDVIVVSAAVPFSTDAPLRKEKTVNLGEASINESFEADADISGVNVTFRPTSQTALKSLWVTEQEAVSMVASEGNNQNDEYISITVNPNVVKSTGTYRFSQDIFATAGIFLFASPNLKHANVGPYANTNVTFNATDGQLEFTSYGTNYGDMITGSFATQISGVRITGTNSIGNYTSQTYTGTIIGTFNLELIPTDTN